MNYDNIRKMSDEELSRFLNNLSKRDVKKCIKCDKRTKKIIKVNYEDTTKQLCGLCDNCYNELLEYLNVPDVLWR